MHKSRYLQKNRHIIALTSFYQKKDFLFLPLSLSAYYDNSILSRTPPPCHEFKSLNSCSNQPHRRINRLDQYTVHISRTFSRNERSSERASERKREEKKNSARKWDSNGNGSCHCIHLIPIRKALFLFRRNYLLLLLHPDFVVAFAASSRHHLFLVFFTLH